MTQPALPSDIEIFQVDMTGSAFSPHRHDSYTFALTRHGVQAFDYRGETRQSRPGEIVVLHPDEWHDGRPGDDAGFGYVGVSLAPAALARPGGGLPFLAGGVSRDPRLMAALERLIANQNGRVPDGAANGEADFIELALALDAVSDAPAPPAEPRRAAVAMAAAHIREHVATHDAATEPTPETTRVSLETLEALTGLSRWSLCRDFRAVMGTSPYRYLTLRRLDRARGEMAAGAGLAEAALAAGFADQAHLTRQFKLAYGLTPGRWRKLADATPSPARTIIQ